MKGQDTMLGILYEKAYQSKREVERHASDEDDRKYAIALEKNSLLSELISARTDQIRRGLD